MRPHSIIRTLAAAALLAVPSLAMAAPDQNTAPGSYNNGCPNGQWVNGQCVNNNGQYNNGRWNNGNNGRHRGRDRDDNRGRDRDDNNNGRYNNNGNWNNGRYNGNYNGGYNGNYGGYNNGYGRGGQLTGTVSSFSPYNLYLTNGLHVELHDGTVINPRGTNLTAGQRVRIIGNRNGDGTYNANEIDVVGNGYRY